MTDVVYKALDGGVTCIDADYIEPGIACFYLLEHKGECAIIETGTSHSVDRLEQLMRVRGIQPEQVRYVVPTHVHLDHAGGAGLMMSQFPQARLLIHPRGARHMIDPSRLVDSSVDVYGELRFRRLYGEITPVPASRVVEIEDGETVSLGGRRLEFRFTRGHANHHFCIWDETSRGWFTGDMFGLSYPWCRFPAGDFVLPATTPTQFDPATFLDSLELLASYRPQRMFLTHYGELAYSKAGSDLLARQIEAYRDIGPRFEGDQDALEKALGDYSLAQLRAFDTVSPEALLRSKLAMDMNLNAQGLLFWMQRRSSGR